MPRYNKELSTQPKLQSGLGREMVSVYGDGDDVNNLKFAKVIKINYLYNTVDVRAVYKGERFIKSEETDGRYSARLPVTFGGMTSANGFAYGETIPISLGDLVLIGFSEGNLKSAVVVNIYKNDVTANELAPIDVSSGDPESSKLFNAVMEKMTLYPSQTYEVTKGDGNVEHTYAGGSFFATKTNATANARMNDTLYDYTSLPRKRLRGRTVYPNNISTPQILFTQQSLFGTEFTRVFFDDDNSLRFSRVSKNNTQRADIQLANTTTTKFRVQMDSIIPNDPESKKYIEFGIVDGIPIMSTPDHNVYLGDKGFMIDDKPFDDYVSALVDALEIRVNDLDKVVMGIKAITDQIDIKLLAEIIGIVKQLKNVTVPKLKKDLTDLTDRVDKLKFDFDNLVNQYDTFKTAQDEYNQHTTDGLNALNQEIVDARGGFGKLVLRLNSEKQKNDAVHDEVTDARGKSASLGNRLDSDRKFSEVVTNEVVVARKGKGNLDIRISDIDTRINGVDTRINGVDTRINGIDGKVGQLTTSVETLTGEVSNLTPLNASYPPVACTGELPFIVQRRGYTTILSGQLTLAVIKTSYVGTVPVAYRPSRIITTSGANKWGSFNVVVTPAGVITLTPNYLVGVGALADVNMTWFVS